MKRLEMLGLVFAIGSLGACEGADMDQEAPPAEEAVPAEGVPGEDPMAGAAGAALTVDSMAAGETYLADASGRALYLLEGEPRDSSTCSDACAEEWPPFLAQQGAPRAEAASIQSDLIGTMQRGDGQTQVTYDGHALYYYHDDTGPGSTAGQDVTDQWGEWYLVRPSGEPLEGEDHNETGGGTAG